MMSVVGTLMGLVVYCTVLPNTQALQWRDFLPGFDPYKDEETLHLEETGRLGFVQLNSGSTSFNTTLNLTGPILLGLGIATATLFYAYFNAFNGAAGGASGGYGTYRSKRDISNLETHSINSLDHPETSLVWMESVHQQLTSSACQNLLVCHLSKDTNKQKFLTSAMDKINKLHTTTQDAQEALRIAIAEGKEGKDCFKIYPKCHLSLNDVDKLLGTLGME